MLKENPYTHRKALPVESPLFFGRQSELNNIDSLLSAETPQCVSIVGEHRIGKSSLAVRVRHRAVSKGSVIVGSVDCSELETSSDSSNSFFQALNKSILNLPENGRIFKTLSIREPLFDSFDAFAAFIKGKDNALRVVLFFDEFDFLLTQPYANDGFFRRLRSLANEPDHNLAYVTASFRSLKDLIHNNPKLQASKFWNIFQNLPLGLFNDRDVQSLREYGFKANNVELTEQGRALIDRCAGNFPFFNQILCFHLFSHMFFDAPLDEDAIKSEIRPHSETLWHKRTKEEQKLLKKLVDTAVDDENSLLGDLKIRGILVKQDDHYYPFSGYFSFLIRNEFSIAEKPGHSIETVINNVEKGVKQGEKVIKILERIWELLKKVLPFIGWGA